MDTTKIRTQYPQYNEVSDGALLYGFYKTTPEYQKMPMGEYADKLGMTSTQFKEMIAAAKESGVTPTTSSGPEGVGNEVITGFSHQDQSFVNPNMQPMGDAEGLLSSAAQGITMGFSDELFGHMAAIKGALGGSNLTYDETYNRMKDFEEKRIMDYRRTDPKKAFAGEVGGAVATSIAATPAMLLLKSPKFLMDLSKGMKAFLTSGAYGGIYGAGTAEEGERGKGALQVGIPSAFLGFGLQKIGAGISNKYDKFWAKANQSPTIETLKSLKNEAYKQTKELGIKFEGALLDKFRRIGIYGDDVNGVKVGGAIDEGYDPALNKYAASAIKLFDTTLQKWKEKGSASIEQLDSLNRQMWAKLRESKDSEVRIYPLINAIDKMIKSHPDASASMIASKQANSVYNKAKMLDIEFKKVLNNDKITGNIGQKYKAAIRNILNSKRLSKFLDDNDIAAMQSFLKGNISDKMLKGVGKLAPSGTLMTLIHLGAVASNPWIAIASAVSLASKSSFNRRTVKGAERLMNYIKQFQPKQPTIPGVAPVSAVGSGQALESLNQ